MHWGEWEGGWRIYMGENSKGDMREMRGQALGECAGGEGGGEGMWG